MAEYLDILDENGNRTGSKETRENVHKKGLLHSEVSAFIYTRSGKILLQKRSSSKKTYANIWSTTGGHVLSGESNEDAIVREIKEELNLDIEKENAKLITVYKSKKENGDIINNKFFSIYNVEIEEEDFKKIKIQTEELEEVKLVTINEVKRAIDTKDKNYKFPQNSELAIEQIEENLA